MYQAVGVQAWRTACACAWTGILGVLLMLAPEAAYTQQGDSIALAKLPKEGRATYALILKGGPFPYEKDATVFGNRERLLPAHPRGYWREYTVKTPGKRGRGARRIVCGGKPRVPDTCYYSSDHYASFRKIQP